MKVFLLALSLSFSYSAFAFINEVECDGRTVDGKRAEVEVERSLGAGLRDATVTIRGARGTNPEITEYRVTHVRRFGTQIEYMGMDRFRLEIDIFPERAPRWGQTYWARFGNLKNLRCRFTGIR